MTEANGNLPSVLDRLPESFARLRRRLGDDEDDGVQSAASDSNNTCNFDNGAVINILDPSAVVTPGSDDQRPRLFERLTYLLDRDYHSTLTSVPYTHVRSKEAGVIANLPVHPLLTPGRVVLPELGVPWENADKKRHERHNEPYGYVYLVTCDNLDHYRTKVKPTIQAFLKQVQALEETPDVGSEEDDKDDYTTTSATTTGSSAKGATTPAANNYLVVYCPSHTASLAAAASSAAAGAAGAEGTAASRMGAAWRKMMAARGTSDAANEEWTLDSAPSEPTPDLLPESLSYHRTDREVARRLAADFGANHVCTMSLMESGGDGSNNGGTELDERQRTEWSLFLPKLAACIVAGFQQRCRRYDEMLRSLELQRSTNPRLVGQLLLMKESLALTYQQMHLPSEALLQYQELRAFVPDMKVVDPNLKEEWELPGDSVKSKWALAGDVLAFRDWLSDGDRSADFASYADLFEQYLFARELTLLFQTADPDEILERCLAYVNVQWSFLIRGSSGKSERVVEAEKWAFSFCWTVKRATESYLDHQRLNQPVGSPNERWLAMAAKSFAKHLCNLMNFARLRLLHLRKLVLPEGKPVQLGWMEKKLPPDLTKAWEPWKVPSGQTDSQHSVVDLDTMKIEDVLSSMTEFEAFYTQFLAIIAELNRLAGRYRTAARLRTEAVELYIRRGEPRKAAFLMRLVADAFAHDGWSACYFFFLFRLSGLQRQFESPQKYLDTLVNCFNSRNVPGPSTALNCLQDDMEAVVACSEVEGIVISQAPLFRVKFGVIGAMLTSNKRDGSIRKVISIGEKVSVELSIDSFAPRDLAIDSLSITLVPYQTYIAMMEMSSVSLEEGSHTIRMDSPVIKSGNTRFEIEWIPHSSGQFVLLSAMLQWKGVEFKYDTQQQNELFRIDVLPSEPTQSLSIEPLFIVPGHEQPLRIEFSSGADVVKEGSVNLVCSPGLALLPPGKENEESNWTTSSKLPLSSCPPGEKVNLLAMVKSVENSDSKDGKSLSLHVQVATSYQFAHADTGSGDSSTEGISNHVMDAVVPGLGQAALTLEGAELLNLTASRRVLNMLVKCHTLVPFTVKSWSLNLPEYLVLADDGDFNKSITDSKVTDREVLSFGFCCSVKPSEGPTSSVAELLIELEDAYGTVFQEKLTTKLPAAVISKAALSEIKSVPVSVNVSEQQIRVGQPLEIEYLADTSKVASLSGQLIYELESSHSDFLLSGSLCGKLSSSEGRVKVIAIPTRPGSLDQFPELSLKLMTSDSEAAVPLTTFIPDKVSLKVISASTQTSVAFPPESPKFFEI